RSSIDLTKSTSGRTISPALLRVNWCVREWAGSSMHECVGPAGSRPVWRYQGDPPHRSCAWSPDLPSDRRRLSRSAEELSLFLFDDERGTRTTQRRRAGPTYPLMSTPAMTRFKLAVL